MHPNVTDLQADIFFNHTSAKNIYGMGKPIAIDRQTISKRSQSTGTPIGKRWAKDTAEKQ